MKVYEAILSVCVNVHAKWDEEINYYCVLSAFVCVRNISIMIFYTI